MENRFFSEVVRIQTDRGHAVSDSGPYRIIRHPDYLGNILSLPGIVLALGSVWTLIPAGVALLIAVVRTALEDRTLQDEMPGPYTWLTIQLVSPGVLRVWVDRSDGTYYSYQIEELMKLGS